MSLDVLPPEPPTVYRETRDDEYHADVSKRADVQEYMDGVENAWEEGFGEWASETSLTEAEYRVMTDLGFVEELDFRWDEETRQVTYFAPRIPDDWQTNERFSTVDSWSTVSVINEEVDDLGETVAGVLTDYYVAWESEERVVKTFGDQFNGRDDVLTDTQNAREEGEE
jgi:hypothetical protein